MTLSASTLMIVDIVIWVVCMLFGIAIFSSLAMETIKN
jgi:hypothetical protein